MKKSQKVVVVTGCSSGMGRATAELLSKSNFIVYAGSRTPEKLQTIASKTLIPTFLDVTNPKIVKEFFATLDRVDVVVNNAGYGLVSTVESVTEEEMFAQFNVNLFGVLRVCKGAIPIMRRQNSGMIINISSFLGRIGLPLLTFYNASKYAIEGVTDSLRYELEPFNIRVCSIMPGFFNTNFARDNLVVNSEILNKNSPYSNLVNNLAPAIIEQINRGNNPKEVANLILKLIENSSNIAHISAGDKSKKFIPMRKELSDEEFEERVKRYYKL
jgi:NAD(P)-dependent dehydrogenase (short-subunit alcohol dehydrogenase family)